MSTLTRLPRPQWRLLNVLVDNSIAAGGTAAGALRVADAGPEHLIPLVDAGMATVADAAGYTRSAEDLRATPALLTQPGTRVYATSEGVQWVVSDPENQVLRCLAGRGSQGMVCRELKRATDASIDTVIDLYARGLVSITTGDSGEPPAQFKGGAVSDSWQVRVTPAGRRIAISQ